LLAAAAALAFAIGPHAPLAVVDIYGAVSLAELAPGQSVGVFFAAALALFAALTAARPAALAALALGALSIAWPLVSPHLFPQPRTMLDVLGDALASPVREALARAALDWVAPAWGGLVLLGGVLAAGFSLRAGRRRGRAR